MPYSGAGIRHTATATKECQHGDLVIEQNFVGTAFKTEQIGRYVDPTDAAATLIEVAELFEVQVGGVHEALRSGNLASLAVGDLVYIDPADNSLHRVAAAAVAAKGTVRTGVVASNNAIRWRAGDVGARDGDVRVSLVDPGGASAALAVDVDGHDVIVSLATSSGSAIISTAAQVIAAVNEDDTASQLLTAANETTSSGAGVVAAVPLTALAGAAAVATEGYVPVGVCEEVDSTRSPAVGRINSEAWNAFLAA